MTDHSTNAARIIDNDPVGMLLTGVARETHPTVAWWWGRRTIDGVGQVYCYICDDTICPWSGTIGRFDAVSRAIAEHRVTHVTHVHAETTATTEAT